MNPKAIFATDLRERNRDTGLVWEKKSRREGLVEVQLLTLGYV